MKLFIILGMIIFVEIILITYIAIKSKDMIDDYRTLKENIITLRDELIKMFGVYELLDWLEIRLERIEKWVKKLIKKVTKY